MYLNSLFLVCLMKIDYCLYFTFLLKQYNAFLIKDFETLANIEKVWKCFFECAGSARDTGRSTRAVHLLACNFFRVVVIRSMHQSACWVFWQEFGTLSLAGVGPSVHHVACLLWPCYRSNPSQRWLRGAEQAIQVRLSSPLLDSTWPTMPLRKGPTTSLEPNRKWTQYIFTY